MTEENDNMEILDDSLKREIVQDGETEGMEASVSPSDGSTAGTGEENASPEKEDGDTPNLIEKVDERLDENKDIEGESMVQMWRSVIGGDFLSGSFIRRQLPLIALIAFFCLSHIAMRYICQKDLVEIDRLKKDLDDAKFNQLTRFSELTSKSRQSYIEDILRQNNDSTLQTSTNPPYIIHIKDKSKNRVESLEDPKIKGLKEGKEITEE